MREQNAVVAIYDTHVGAEEALKKIQRAGIDMRTLSIVGRDSHTEEHPVGYYNTGDRMKYWGKFGAFWGGFWGLLFGSAFFAIPGIGPVLAAGPVVAWIVGALEGAAVLGGVSDRTRNRRRPRCQTSILAQPLRTHPSNEIENLLIDVGDLAIHGLALE